MSETFIDRLYHAYNAFKNREDPKEFTYPNYGMSTSIRPDRHRLSITNERSIISSIYNRISIDVASVTIMHARKDENERYKETIKSYLNDCLSIEANLDQSGRELIQDIVISMFDEGCVAVVPVDTTLNPNITGSFDVLSLRVAQIIEWFPNHVRVKIYNEKKGYKEEITVSKRSVAIIENPLYTVMNEPNSTLKRLIRKLNLLDSIDEQSGSGKLDIIIQLPYVIKSESRREQAEIRRQQIETQLSGSKYGIAYTDGTEKITQLNRPAENNLMKQIEYLTNMLYGQLGITESIFDGTADESTMLNYFNRTVEPILGAICDGMTRKFLTKTARTQRQAVMYVRNPFKLAPVNTIAEVADKFTRNEILSSNDVRAIIGYKPSDDPEADKLRNKNINPPSPQDGNQNGNEEEEKKIEQKNKLRL